ncbi:MAG: serine protease, partial [Deltaproteobacteria bacterium]
LTYRDGAHRVTATRGAPGRVTLRWEDGRTTTAGVTRDAVAQLPLDGAARVAAAVRARLEIVRPVAPRLGLHVVRSLDAHEDGLDVAVRLADDASVAMIVPDLRLRHRLAFEPPADDPRREGQWYLDTIGVDAAWGVVTGDAETVIGVVDNGCELDHPDLVANMLPGRDVFDQDDDPSYAGRTPGANHGTSCAGIIAAEGDNGLGVVGVCPECRLRCVRLLGPDEAGDGTQPGVEVPISADTEAFAVQVAWGVAVSSNSWGFVDRFPVPAPLEAAITDLIQNGRDGLGAVVVFAAGNDSREVFDDELYGIAGLVTVGAINVFDEAAQYSNYGAGVDLTAPTGALTTDITGADGDAPGDYTSTFGGTSSACPVVAGVAGLLVSAAPTATGEELAEALITTTRKAPFAVPDEDGHDPLYGYGIVDPFGALDALGAVPDPGPEPSPEPSPEAVAEPDEEADAVGGDVGEADTEPVTLKPPIGHGCNGAGDAPGTLAFFALLAVAALRRRRALG